MLAEAPGVDGVESALASAEFDGLAWPDRPDTFGTSAAKAGIDAISVAAAMKPKNFDVMDLEKSEPFPQNPFPTDMFRPSALLETAASPNIRQSPTQSPPRDELAQ